MPAIPFNNSYAQLPENFYSKLSPAQVPNPQLVRVNAQLAKELGIDPEWLESPEGIAFLAGNQIAEGSEPLAQAYAGHQFGHYNPQLGDGRAILLGEILDSNGKRFDLQLKGSGRTPYSRGGDGKAALGPVLREYILSEAMAALGVPTTRALAAITSGETVVRQDGPLPGAVFTRIASSHIRVGTFQWVTAKKDTESLRALADYTLARHYPTAQQDDSPYRALLQSVINAQADLVAHWMALGFIHGVMNTDNTAVSGETIDYGPCAFMDDFHPQCVFSSIDANARYAWGNQASIALWNLTRFAETLLPLFAKTTEQAIEIAESCLDSFQSYFESRYLEHFRLKFGLPTSAPSALIQDGLSLLANQQVDFTRFFTELTRSAANGKCDDLYALFIDPASFELWHKQWKVATNTKPDFTAMQRANPVRIPRNHQVEQAIQAAYKGDFSRFHALVEALAQPYTENTDLAEYESLPLPHQRVTETFCGT
ncbi:protein adenylyltransferase SelO [Rubritalea sp.]|uniref:protein adenylyltransferase SelO n=1 Tax=Rubritalea sp. TaxID=2109375 RepID=UPI003EF76FDC